MLQTLIEQEKRRLAQRGYDSVVNTEELTIFQNHCVVPLGNDSIIITKLVYDEDAVFGDNPRISLCCPTTEITGTVRNLSAYGAGLFKVMRNYMTVNRWSQSTGDTTNIPMQIQIVRITPKKHN